MSKKNELLRNTTEIAKGIGPSLKYDDALRLAVADKRFASAFLSEPEKYAPIFNLGKEEMAALREVGGVLGTGDISAEGFQYE